MEPRHLRPFPLLNSLFLRCVPIAIYLRMNAFGQKIALHKVLIYIQNTTVYVLSSELGLPQPLSRKRVCLPWTKGWGDKLACGWGGWGSGSPSSDYWRKSLALGILYAVQYMHWLSLQSYPQYATGSPQLITLAQTELLYCNCYILRLYTKLYMFVRKNLDIWVTNFLIPSPTDTSFPFSHL
jgi:hypothetical protein